MDKIIFLNIRKTLLIILGISFFLYFLIHLDKNIIDIFYSYFKWIINFIIGNYGQSSNGSNIVLFNLSGAAKTISIGPKYLYTIFTTIFSILFSFIIALLCNYLIIVKKSSFSLIIKNILEWFSTIHIIIISIVAFSIYQHDISFLLGVIIISISSNAFYELSSLQHSDIATLNAKDFIIAARAWGDTVSKHMKRSFLINSINQLFSLWIIFFSNCMIFEMFFQKAGLGFLLWKYFLDTSSGSISDAVSSISIIPEPNIFLTISMLVVITMCSINTVRVILLNYLIDFKR